jgi:hypothetical protein
MANVDKNVEITVTPNPNPTGPKDRYLFSMDDGKGATQELAFDKTKDNMKKSDAYKIKFKLKNKDGANLRFSKDIDKVLWVMPVASKTDPCPTSDCKWPIFYVDPKDPIKDLELTVINTDPAVQLFKFAFNFLPPGKSDPLPNSEYEYYDPIGSNQNGGSSTSIGGGGTFAAAAGGAVIGAAANLLLTTAATTQSLAMWAVVGAVIGYFAGMLLGGMGRGSPA